MNFLMSRFGCNNFLFGQGFASKVGLPEDQSLVNMLNHHARDLSPHLRFLSAQTTWTEWMQPYEKLPLRNALKVGTLKHVLIDWQLTNDIVGESDIYIGSMEFVNTFAVFIRTRSESIAGMIEGYRPTYDLVLTVEVLGVTEFYRLSKDPETLEKILYLTAYLQEGSIEEVIMGFEPSRTALGRIVPARLMDTIATVLVGIDTDEKLLQQVFSTL